MNESNCEALLHPPRPLPLHRAANVPFHVVAPIVNVNVEAPKGYTGKVTQQKNSSGGVDLRVQVLEIVANDVASGGMVHGAVQRRFGLNPGGTTPRY